MFNRELLKGSTALLVLQLLAERPMYGYELVKILGERSGQALQMKEGTLYPALHKLEREGHIEPIWKPQPKGKPRKYNQLTAEGERVLQDKMQEWRKFSSMMDRMLSRMS